MGKREPILDWQVQEEGAARPPSPVMSTGGIPSARRPPRRWRWWALGIVLTLLLPALVEGYREVQRADAAMTRVENEVRAAVAAEMWVDAHAARTVDIVTAPLTGLARQEAFLARVSSESDPVMAGAQDSAVEIRRVEVRGDYALVELWRNQSKMRWMPVPYRWTRFYHASGLGWLPVDAPDIFYRPLATLQAGRFTFVYGPLDANAVLEASRRVEAVDVELRLELGLSPTDEALTIKVITNVLSLLDPVELMGMSTGATLYAPSPAQLPLPALISEGNALAQMAVGLLIQRNLEEALGGSRVACEAQQPVVNGLRLWLLHEHSGLPSRAHYTAESSLRYRLNGNVWPHLTWLEPSHVIAPSDALARHHCDSPAIDGVPVAFVEYAAVAYGRDHLPTLIDGMKRYATVAELIPAVYGVSVAEFETGWREYLKETAGD